MNIKAKIEQIDGFWVDDRNNKWGTGFITKDEANENSLSMMGCRDCLDCYNMIDCDGCIDCVACVRCTEVMNGNGLSDVHA